MDYCIICEAWVRPTEEDDCPDCGCILAFYCNKCDERFAPDEINEDTGYCALCDGLWDSLTC